MPTKLMEVAISCRKYLQTKMFYTRVLNLPIGREGRHHVFLDTGGSYRIALVDASQGSSLVRPTGRGPYLNLSVEDLPALKRKLILAGIAIEDERSDQYGRNITIRDPEGNVVNVYQEGTF